MFLLEVSNLSKEAREARLYTNKLKNMQLHLKEILAKKLRLEIEINLLKKTILKKQKEYESRLKVKVKLGLNENFSDLQKEELRKEDQLLYNALLEFDVTEREILELLKEIEEKDK